MSEANIADSKNRIYNIIIIVLSATLLVICLVIGFLFLQRSKADANANAAVGNNVTSGTTTTAPPASGNAGTSENTGALATAAPGAAATPAPGQIAIPSYSSINIKADLTSVEVPFRNPDVNSVYLVLTLTLDDGIELYKSNYIAPGEGVGTVTLNKALAAGIYTGKLKYEPFSMEDYSQRNGTELPITINVQ